jgi:transcriptional regulator with XRE-family HTH domain
MAMQLTRFNLVISVRPVELVAEALGVSRVTVWRWRCGLRKPNKTVLLLAERVWPEPTFREVQVTRDSRPTLP